MIDWINRFLRSAYNDLKLKYHTINGELSNASFYLSKPLLINEKSVRAAKNCKFICLENFKGKNMLIIKHNLKMEDCSLEYK